LVLYFYGPARLPVSPQESTVTSNILSNKGPEPVVVVEEDLRRSEAKNGLTQDAAERIFSELTILDGAVYEIPDFALLKHELGFPAGTTFRADDLKELLLSHLQFTLGIGPVTASYLSGRLGVSAQPMATKVDPNAIDEDGTLFVMFKESGASGAEAAGRGIKSPSASDTSLDLPQMDGEDALVNEEPRLRSVEW
jgi:hypothetical protein